MDLPPHIFIDILTLLPQKQTYRTVCKQWNTTIGPLIKTLYVQEKWVFAWEAFPSLEKIILSERVPWVNPLSLIHLELIQWIPPLGWLSEVKVRHLTWVGLENSGQCLYNLLDDLSNNPSIRKLTIIGKQGWCDECIPLYAGLVHLDELEMISGTRMTLAQVRAMYKLSHLTLLNCEFNEEENVTENMAAAILSLPSLESVTLSENLVSLEGWAQLESVAHRIRDERLEEKPLEDSDQIFIFPVSSSDSLSSSSDSLSSYSSNDESNSSHLSVDEIIRQL